MDKFSTKNLYEILHIKEDATPEEIRFAYRRLARIYHPDINESQESIKIFKEIRYAYDILSDKKKKELYDIKINHKNKKEENNINETVIKEENSDNITKSCKNKSFSKILGEILDGIFINIKNTSKERTKKQKAEDIFANVSISSKEAVLGTSRIINIMQTKTCPNCEGKKFINEALCPLCKGHGEISTHKRLNAIIPPNSKDGDKIKIENCGNQASPEGKPGDLYLIISIDEKSLFTVKDNIVYMDLPITPFEAALGANIEIPTFYENITIKIPPNTSSGQKFRLKGQGIYLKNDGENGDMIVTVIIKLPPKII